MNRGDRGLQSASGANGWPERWSPTSPAVTFSIHALPNEPRRPRAPKRVWSERVAGTLEPDVPGGNVLHPCAASGQTGMSAALLLRAFTHAFPVAFDNYGTNGTQGTNGVPLLTTHFLRASALNLPHHQPPTTHSLSCSASQRPRRRRADMASAARATPARRCAPGKASRRRLRTRSAARAA
jgi:hypothetical protein